MEQQPTSSSNWIQDVTSAEESVTSSSSQAFDWKTHYLWLPYVILATLLILFFLASFLRFRFVNRERYEKRRAWIAEQEVAMMKSAERSSAQAVRWSSGSGRRENRKKPRKSSGRTVYPWTKLTQDDYRYMAARSVRRHGSDRSTRSRDSSYAGTNMFQMMFMPRTRHSSQSSY